MQKIVQKVGIITFHRAINYGAILQVYALHNVLEELGCDVQVIDYRCPAIENKYKLFSMRHIFRRKNPIFLMKEIFSQIFTLNGRIKRRDQFETFTRNHLNLTLESYSNYQDICPSLDIYISGSDQIWSFNLTDGIDPAFFLAFNTKKNAKKLSYAASLEQKNFDTIIANGAKLTTYLNNLNSISVREKSLIALLQPYTKNEVVNVLDPTLLKEATFYSSISVDPKINEKYLLIFQIVSKPETMELAEKIAKTKGYKIIQIYSDILPFRRKKDRSNQTLSPNEFLGYFKNASFIITTSFHGTAFSIIFQKEFFVIGSGVDNRQKDLLDNLELKHRLVSGVSNAKWTDEINYKEVHKKLSLLRKESLNYLNSNISA